MATKNFDKQRQRLEIIKEKIEIIEKNNRTPKPIKEVLRYNAELLEQSYAECAMLLRELHGKVVVATKESVKKV